MKKIALALGAVMLVSACATAKVWQPTGGSRSDGVVRLSYQYGMFETPELSDDGVELAVERCKVWGYTGATAFGGVTTQCNQMSNSGCVSTLVTKEFQCTGQGNGGYAEILVRSPARGRH
jgi:hypothetical protein